MKISSYTMAIPGYDIDKIYRLNDPCVNDQSESERTYYEKKIKDLVKKIF